MVEERENGSYGEGLRRKYLGCMEGYKNEYFEAYENVQRLQWFLVMEENL